MLRQKTNFLNFIGPAKNIVTAADLIREYGTVRFTRIIIPWLLQRRYYVYIQTIQPVAPASSCQIRFSLRLLKETEIGHIVNMRPYLYRFSTLHKRLKEGHFCFVCWIGDEPIHVRWIFTDSHYISYLSKTLQLGPKDVFVDEAYTAAAYRRSGVYSHTGFLVRPILKEMGYNRLLCTFASWDFLSRRIAERLGMRNSGEIGYKNIMGCKLFYSKGMFRLNGHRLTLINT